MIDIKNGLIKINEQLEISLGYTFEQFKKTKYYKEQDGIRIIYLEEPQNIEGKKFIVSLFFRDSVIYLVSLIYCEKELSESDESQRKKIHDEILIQKGIDVEKQYNWGKVTSEYDARSNISSINVYYTK